MPAICSRSASTAIVFTLAVLVALIAVVFGNAMPTASQVKRVASNIKIDTSLPPIINWAKEGVVGPVRNQGQCGDAEIFSVFDNIVAVNNIVNKGVNATLSLQQFIQCIPNACNGLAEDAIWKYLKSVKGYVAGNTTNVTPAFCAEAAKPTPGGARVIASKQILGDETAMHAALVNGPITVDVDADSWETYTSGVLGNCPANTIDDSALIVGINTVANPPYWLIRNSWGAAWGEGGYIQIKYGSNQCGITSNPTSVEVQKN